MAENNPDALEEISDHGFTPLGMATHFGNEDIVRFLLEKGADPNAHSKTGYNVYPLHAAIGSGFDGIAKILIEAGGEVNVLQTSSTSPLTHAAQLGTNDLLIFLLAKGEPVDINNEIGKCESELANDKGHTEIARIMK